MPGTGLTETIRQIAQFPTKTAAAPSDLLLVQNGGLGGPYQTIPAANLVASALGNVTDEMVIGGILNVGGEAVIDGAIFGGGTLEIRGEATFLGDVSAEGEVNAGSTMSCVGNFNTDGVVFATTGLTTDGVMTAGGGILVGNNSKIDGALTVCGPITATGALSAGGPFYMSGDGSFTGNLLLGGGAQFGGGAKFGGGIYTAGSITAEGGLGLLDCLSVGNDATIGGAATINGNLTAPGCVELGPTGITGDLGVFGNLCLAGNFTAEGITKLTAGAMCVTGDVGICGALDVAGLVQAGSLLVKDGVATCGDVSIGGRLNVARGGSFHGPTDIQGDLTVNGRVGICGFLHLNGMAVATEPWVTGYVCHVGADLLSALSDTAQELESKITASIAGVASFNHRTGAVELLADDITGADGVLRPAGDSGLWYAWHDGDWAVFEPGSGGGSGDGIPEPSSNGLFGRNRNGGTSWQPVPPLPPSDATNYYAWRNGAWTVFDPGAGGGGGLTQQDLDNALANYLPLTGGTLSGALTLPSTDASGNQAVRYAQLNTALGGYLPLTGGNLTGPLNLAADGNGSQAVRYSQLSTMLAAYATTAAMTTAIGTATAGMATQSWVGTQIADMATQTWTGGQISTAIASLPSQSWVNGQISTATADMATQTWTNSAITTAINALPPSANTLQLSFVIPGKPAANQYYNVPVTIPFTIADFATTRIYAGTATTDSKNFRVFRSGTQVAQINLVANGTVSVTSQTVPANYAAGDVLQIQAPPTQDSTLADVGISILTTRT